MPGDIQHMDRPYRLPEIEHRYGENIHIVDDPFLFSILAKLCEATCKQPWLDLELTALYQGLLHYVVNREFPRSNRVVESRMSATHPEGKFFANVIDEKTKVVCVSLARAGIVPTHTCFLALGHLLSPENVRQDHVSINRKTDDRDQVVGTQLGGVKIGGSVEGAWLLVPDPMGATGSTVRTTLDLYRGHGTPRGCIAIHLIVTPEYLRTAKRDFPEMKVYALRVDRGLSASDVLKTVPGSLWERERGLNEKQYIVPGAGGLGELINNSDI